MRVDNCNERQEHSLPRYGLLLGCILLLGLGLMLSWLEPAWAQPHQDSLHQTIKPPDPTLTPGPTATASPTVAPGVTRVLLRNGPTYNGARDVWISSYQPSFPTQLDGALSIRRDSAKSILVRFDLEGVLPPGANVIGAELVFYVDSWLEARPLYAQIFRVLRPWDWGLSWVTWNQASAGVVWGQAGCSQVAVEPFDRVNVPDDTVIMPYRGVYSGFNVTSSVRHWVEHPTKNYGWLIKGDDLGYAEYFFASARIAQVERRPVLRIDYTVSATPVTTATPVATNTTTPPSQTPTLTRTPTKTATPTVTTTPSAGNVGQLTVIVYDDLNRNGVRDAGEGGLAGVVIQVSDAAGLVAQGITGLDGVWQISGLPSGEYRIREYNPSGFLSSTDDVVVAYLGQSLTVVFGDYFVPSATPVPGNSRIEVLVYNDANRNGILDAGEVGIAGTWVELRDASRRLLASRFTDAEGRVAFEGLAPGVYRLREINRPTYVSSTGDDVLAYVGQRLLVTFGDHP
jgi:hypothetical protein